MNNKKFMTRDKEFNKETLNEIKENFQPIDFYEQTQLVNMIPQYNVTEFMMSQQMIQTTMNLTITEDGILDNKIIRQNMLDRTNVLNKVKEIFLLSGLEYCNMKMVAEYFEVDIDAIESCIRRNQEELIENGLIKISGSELRNMISLVTDNMTVTKIEPMKGSFGYDNQIFRNSTNTLLNRRVILNIAMLLRDSEVAKKIRSLLLDLSETDYGKNFLEQRVNELMSDINIVKDGLRFLEKQSEQRETGLYNRIIVDLSIMNKINDLIHTTGFDAEYLKNSERISEYEYNVYKYWNQIICDIPK